VGTSTRDKAKLFSGSIDVSLKDFTESALGYFVRYKLNPMEVNQLEDVSKEVHRLRNQVFGFLKTQEEQYSVPLLQQVYSLPGQINSVAQMMEVLVGSLKQMHLLLFKIKTIQDIHLTTAYYLSGREEEELQELVKGNKERFERELSRFEKKLTSPQDNSTSV